MTNNEVKPRCVIDRSILNADTIKSMSNAGLSIYAPLCGENRGAFVLDPPDGHTYSCLSIPPSFATDAGVNSTTPLKDANSILWQMASNDITTANAVDMLDMFVQAVYKTSADVDQSPFACDVSGLAKLECDASITKAPGELASPIRAVTLAGLFVPELWATNGVPLSLKESANEYSPQDFDEMKALGINAVQIPVPLSAFVSPDAVVDVITHVLSFVEESGLKAILQLDPTNLVPDLVVKATGTAAAYAANTSAVAALTLPNIQPNILRKARQAAPSLPLFIPVNMGHLPRLAEYSMGDPNVFASLDLNHATTPADVASSTPLDDRMKLYYHESMACINRSPLEYAACYQNVPVFVAQGFDLSIDDCVNKNLVEAGYEFRDYGQCDRFEDTINSNWWHNHRVSFAKRQMASYERGLGWSFAAWKVRSGSESGIIDSPAKLLALKDVAAAGLMPSLDNSTLQSECLNPPLSDFVLGDATLAPTPSPPPNCGNGWWNATTEKCDYWIPPPPPPPPPACIGPTTNNDLLKAGGAGGLLGLIVGLAFMSLCCSKRRGYEQLPA